MNVKGWVKNLADGSVEMVAQGNKEDVDDLISWANTGPRLANVEDVEVDREEPKNEFDNFSIRY